MKKKHVEDVLIPEVIGELEDCYRPYVPRWMRLTGAAAMSGLALFRVGGLSIDIPGLGGLNGLPGLDNADGHHLFDGLGMHIMDIPHAFAEDGKHGNADHKSPPKAEEAPKQEVRGQNQPARPNNDHNRNATQAGATTGGQDAGHGNSAEAPGCAWGAGGLTAPNPPHGGVQGQTQTAPGCSPHEHAVASNAAEKSAKSANTPGGETAAANVNAPNNEAPSANTGATPAGETAPAQTVAGTTTNNTTNTTTNAGTGGGGESGPSGSVQGVTISGPSPSPSSEAAGATINGPESEMAGVTIPGGLPQTGAGGLAGGIIGVGLGVAPLAALGALLRKRIVRR
jgi:hypothetical protein